jgi:toluene monooxygenase system ferredoxin subunit
MAFTRICTLDDIWEGEMEAFEVDGHEVVVTCIEGGDLKAYQAVCPHQDIPLIEGKFDGKTLICRAHQWVFDACTGKGVNPSGCQLASYPIRIEGNEVFIDTADVVPMFAHT